MSKTIPDDFPRDPFQGAVPGDQPKFLARKIGDKYVVGLTEEELLERYEVCLDFVEQLVQYCQRKQMENADWSQHFILDRMRNGIASGEYGLSKQELGWITGKVESELGWH